MKKYHNKYYCCNVMEYEASVRKNIIDYDSSIRSYHIILYNDSSGSLMPIYNCPWCGTKLPKDLGDKWSEILAKEYGIECPFDEEERNKIPKEFQTDEWWKKRGL